jgi:hypothetical protein
MPIILLVLIAGLQLFVPGARADGTTNSPAEFNFRDLMQPVPTSAVLIDDLYFTWGASMVKDDHGKCHLFYSRWLRKDGFSSWVTRSEIAHAVSDSPLGPFKFRDVALPARGAQYWDGLVTHNPTVHKFDGKYYIYYMGTTGDGKVVKSLSFSHRSRQQIGVAVADSPNGPWKRLDEPIIAKSKDPQAADAFLCANPSVVKKPDGTYLMIYKASAQKLPLPFAGPMSHLIAEAKSPEGPFVKTQKECFGHDDPAVTFPTEDPTIWYQDGTYYAILKDMAGYFTGEGKSLILFESADGYQWRLAKNFFICSTEIKWSNGTTQRVQRLERPQLYIEDGIPAVLYCAVMADKGNKQSFNVHIPLGKIKN